MSAIAVVSLAASFGEYAGPIWWARLVPGASAVLGDPDPAGIMGIRPDGKLRDGDGSPYWAMATFLPGFKLFRFPSKLLTWTTLSLAALAAQGLDALGSGDRRIRRRIAVYSSALLAMTIVALVVATPGRESFIARLQGRARGFVWADRRESGVLRPLSRARAGWNDPRRGAGPGDPQGPSGARLLLAGARGSYS